MDPIDSIETGDVHDVADVSQDQDVQEILTAHERAVDQLARAQLDNLSDVFFANARISHSVGAALSRLNSRARSWSHEEAKTIRDEHKSVKSHVFNIAGGLLQAAVGVYAIRQQQGLDSLAANFHAKMMQIQTNQQSGSAVGSLVQQGHGWFDASKQASIAIASSHQGALSSSNQQRGQDASEVKRAAQQAVEKAAQSTHAKDQAFTSMSR